MELMPSRAAAAAGLTDEELESRLMGLTAIERKATTILLAHLGEFDRRRLFAERGQPSIFQYCVKVLGYSEQAAYKRIQAARAAREHPILLERLWHGDLNLTAIVILAPHFRNGNLRELLESARGKTKLQLEALAAELAPRPDCMDLLRALPMETRIMPDQAAAIGGLGIPRDAPYVMPEAVKPREIVEPLSADRFLFRFTGSGALRMKYSRAKSLLQAESARTMEGVFNRALDALLDRLDPERRLLRRASRKTRVLASSGESSRAVPLALRDEVWRRDSGRCSFVSSDGIRCPSMERLEIDHIQPYARGGRSEIGNLRLLCRAHNMLMARRAFGPHHHGEWDSRSG